MFHWLEYALVITSSNSHMSLEKHLEICTACLVVGWTCDLLSHASKPIYYLQLNEFCFFLFLPFIFGSREEKGACRFYIKMCIWKAKKCEMVGSEASSLSADSLLLGSRQLAAFRANFVLHLVCPWVRVCSLVWPPSL